MTKDELGRSSTSGAGASTPNAFGNLDCMHPFWDPVEKRSIEAELYVCCRK